LLALVHLREGDTTTAAALLEESVALARATGDRWSLALGLVALGDVARSRGDHARAGRLYEECVALRGDLFGGLPTLWESLLHNLGYIALRQGRPRRAAELFRESLCLFRRCGDQRGAAECLIGLGCVAAAAGQPGRAARLFAAAEAALDRQHARLSPSNRMDYDHWRLRAQARLSTGAWQAAWVAGDKLCLDEAVAEGEQAWQVAEAIPARAVDPLTAREREVARLVGLGSSNRQIGEALVITEATAERHLANIRAKLGFTSRTQVAAWAVEQGLVGLPDTP
jgi:non-specific serine/threonine protein kinase